MTNTATHIPAPWGRLHWAGVLIGVCIAAVTVAIPLIPGADETLQWERGASYPGALIGWLTGHCTHWSWDHLVWDLAAFFFLSFAALRLIPKVYMPCLLLAGVLIPLEIVLNQPHIDTYRGLSGIDSALFGLVVAGLWLAGGKDADVRFSMSRVLAVLGAVCFFGKSLFELGTGQTLFVSSEEAGFITVVSAHVTGMLCGLVAGIFAARIPARNGYPEKFAHRAIGNTHG